MMETIMIIDDDIAVCDSLKFALKNKYNLVFANDPENAIRNFNLNEIDVVLLDLKLGNYDGMTLFHEFKKIDDNIVVIVMTAFGTIKSSIEAIKKGVFDYITKPIDLEEMEFTIEKAFEFKTLISQLNYLNEKLKKRELEGAVIKSLSMKKVYEVVEKVKDIDTNILITGESGTGKEVIAKTIHYQGRRKDAKFIAINCSAIPSNLLESELFGHESGSFTGATKTKKGLFEIANHGTLFLDEIGEMDILLQSKLLRAIQEKEITPVGSGISKKIDVRIVAATNKNLEKSIAQGSFREDLFYRLNVINIHLPSLKDRREDIPDLVEFFMKKFNQELNKSVQRVTPEFLNCLQNYDYKGNIRELENIVERAVALSDRDFLDEKDLPVQMRLIDKISNYDSGLIPVFVGEKLKDIEKKVIIRNYENYHLSQKMTAESLGITDRTVRNKLKEYGLI